MKALFIYFLDIFFVNNIGITLFSYEDASIQGEVNCTPSAGIEWGKAAGFLMVNIGLFNCIKTLHVS